MTIAYWCVLATAFMPLLWTGVAKSGGFDNRAPRQSLAALHGWRQRADWAQHNAFENFPPFAAAVIIAHQLDMAQARLDLLAIAYVTVRLLHGLLYIADLALARTLVYVAGLGLIVTIFVGAA